MEPYNGPASHGSIASEGSKAISIMGDLISIPLWLLVVLATISGLTVIRRVIVPTVQWTLRRNVRKAIREINTRLELPLRPFQLTKKQILVDRLLYDAEVA